MTGPAPHSGEGSSRRMRIAIDGPSGTGKSSLSRRLARELNAAYLDTGAMYRVATLHALRCGLSPDDIDGVIEATIDLPLGIGSDPLSEEVLLDGTDVREEIRSKEVTSAVSAVSAVPQVRKNLVRAQRKLAEQFSVIVMEGRDIGTVVIPDAEVKIFLTASPEVRAQRRLDQDRAAGRDHDYNEVLAAVKLRDDKDSSRKESPLKPADDAEVIDTSQMAIDDVLDRLLAAVRTRTGEQQ